MWSRSTLVIAATPPSQACVASRRPPSPTSTTARSTASSANQVKTIAVSSSNSVGGAEAARDPIRCGERRVDVRRANVVGVDRHAVDDLHPLAVGHEVRLGRLAGSQARRPQRRAAARARTLPLPFVPATSAPRTAELRVAERAEQGPHAPEPEPDPEPAPFRQRVERRRR